MNTSQARQELAKIHVAPIAEREGQALNSALRRHLNPNGIRAERAYVLELLVTTSVTNSFRVDQGIRRARGAMKATGSLTSLDDQVLWSGEFYQTSLFAQHELPSLALEAQETLWAELADLIARDAAIELSSALNRSNQIISVP